MKALASSNGIASGIGSTRAACVFTFSAKPPQPSRADHALTDLHAGHARADAFDDARDFAARRKRALGLNWYLSSMISASGKFTPAAFTAITTSPSPATGSGASA